jgi:hypothetical protein
MIEQCKASIVNDWADGGPVSSSLSVMFAFARVEEIDQRTLMSVDRGEAGVSVAMR